VTAQPKHDDAEERTTTVDPRRAPWRRLGDTTLIDMGGLEAARQLEEGKEPLLLVCHGLQRGRPIPVRGGICTVGRGPRCDVSLQGRGLSRIHARIVFTPETGVVLEDAGSTNGIYVNGKRVERRNLRDRDVVHLGPETILRFAYVPSSELEVLVRQYEHSVVDELTGIHNRRYLMQLLEHEMAFAIRHDLPLCLMLLDIDRFKQINDDLGHAAGDAVIRGLAERIAEALRSEDVFARVGGEEFAILTRGVGLGKVRASAERVRQLVQEQPFAWEDRPITCTISIGGSMLEPQAPQNASHFLRRADENLYRAKRDGRNRIVID
jgi:diguanylate cyclase (GGDEF)-like protein